MPRSRRPHAAEGKGDRAATRKPRTPPGEKRGDLIVGSVGTGSRGVAIGKGIVQIGTLVVPIRLVLALFGALAGALAGFILVPILTAPSAMSGPFNVAVAEFGQANQDGGVTYSADGQRLSQWIFTNLQKEYASLPPGVVPQVWHDSMDPREKRVKLGIVVGDTPEARTQAAAGLAQQINAHMVVYGNLALAQEPASFIPEFYVAKLSGEADEIVGRHQLGSGIPLYLPLNLNDPAVAGELDEELTFRATALSRFTTGLLYEIRGRPDRALDVFEQADRDLKDWGRDQAQPKGKEILYLFMGREAHLLHRDDQALSAFQHALAIKPDYARAHIGIANVYYTKAQDQSAQERLAGGDLKRAEEEYRQALGLAAGAPGAQVDVKAHLGLSGTYRLQGAAYLALGQYEAADPLFDQAIREAREAVSLAGEGQHRYAGHAYLGIGNAYHQKAHMRVAGGDNEAAKGLFEQAITGYERCVEHANAEPADWFLAQLKTDYCLPYDETAKDVLRTLERSS